MDPNFRNGSRATRHRLWGKSDAGSAELLLAPAASASQEAGESAAGHVPTDFAEMGERLAGLDAEKTVHIVQIQSRAGFGADFWSRAECGIAAESECANANDGGARMVLFRLCNRPDSPKTRMTPHS